MRKKLLVTLLCCLTAVAMYAGKEESYVLYEGFEQAIPDTWTQECVSATQQAWEIENGATSVYPQGAAAGQSFVALRNHTTQTQHFVSRLISPMFDIKETLQPILIFSHAQMQRTGDVDVLRVYYRTSADARWVQIGEFTNKTKGWQQDTIALTAQSATYQIAFEGEDMMGRGIALDEVIVRPIPTCDNPYNITADGLTSTTATLRWLGSLDTDSFLVAVSTVQQTDPENPTDLVSLQTVTDFECKIAELERNTKYYAYVQAYCGKSVSEWSEFSFRTKNLVDIPYKQTFDMNYASGTLNHVAYWSYGTSILKDDGSMEYMPYVNQNISESSWRSYSYTQTTCLVFTGARSISTEIPRGQYVYAATPEINTDDIKNVQVSFWGTSYTYVGDEYASGLIVGVMTDPSDYSTFVPVDTVYALGDRMHNYYTVYFDQYQGNGKYIAFSSDFKDKSNIFYLDEVEVKEVPALKTVTDVEVINYGGASFQVSANLHGNQRVQLIVARDTTDQKKGGVIFDPMTLPADYLLVNVELSASQLPYNVQLPQGGRFVQVYMRPTDGINYGDFSLPVKVLVPMQLQTYPFVTEFKATDPTGIWSTQQLSNYSYTTRNYTFPYCVLSTASADCADNMAWVYNNELLLGREIEYSGSAVHCEQLTGDYIALPAVGAEKNLLLSFTMKGYSSSYKDISRVAVGMMTDPFDVHTFDTIAICEESDGVYHSFVVDLSTYKGKGLFPAIMAIDAKERYYYSGGTYTKYKTSYQKINNVTISLKEGCIIPSDFRITISYDKATIAWNANGMNKWFVKIYADEQGKNVLDSVSVTTNQCVLDELNPHTTYYYSVHADCDTIATEGDIYSFTTECLPKESLPYIEDFESWKGGSGNEITEPMCWTMERLKYTSSGGGSSSTSYYPYIYTSASSAHKGQKCLYFSYTGSISASLRPAVLYAALPEMAVSLDSLQMQFYAKPGGTTYVGDTLFVGVMTDPDDISTFDTVATCCLAENAYAEYIVRFNTYQGAGKHIAFALAKGKDTRTVYLDDIKVDYLSDCEKVQGVNATDETIEGATVSWTKGDATQWDVLLATTDTVEFTSAVAVDGDVVLSINRVDTNAITLTNCPKANTRYYVFVRSVCSETNKGEWSIPASFKTSCTALTPEEMGLIDFSHADELDCWTVGVREGGTASNLPTRNTNGYLYMFNTDKTDGAYAIMPPLNIDSITRLQVSFDAHGGSDATYLRELTVGVISNPSDLSTFTAVATLSVNRVSATTAATGYGFNEAARYTVRFNQYDGDYNGDYGKQIMFLSESGDKKNYIYIDNIKVDTIGICMEPISIKANEINTYDVTLEWDSLGGDYEVVIADKETKAIVKDVIVNDTNGVTISGLDMLTRYTASVRHICGVGDTSVWSNTISFRTACPAQYPLPYEEDFEGYSSGAGNLPDCWEGFTNSTTAYPYVYNSAKKDGANGLRMYRSTSNYSYAALPKFALSANQLMLSFDWRNSSASYVTYLEVGVATDITSAAAIDSTFTLIDGLSAPKYAAPNNVWNSYIKQLNTYTGTDGYIVLRAPKADKTANNGAVYVDNIRVEAIPTCFRPLNPEVLTTTTTSVKLTWTPYGEETAWDIAYLPAGGNVADATILAVDKDTAVVTGLTHSTDYDFYVRANCGGGDVSAWSRSVKGTTLMVVEPENAQWNFDDVNTQHPSELSATYRLENGWLFGNTKSPITASNIPYNVKNTYNSTGNKTRNSHYALNDSCALKIGTTSASTNGAYAILPEINADLDTMQIRFYGRAIYATGSKVTNTDSVYYNTYAKGSYQHGIKVGTLTDPYDLTTFELLKDYTFQEVTDEQKTVMVEDGYWEEVIVPLFGAAGKYIALVSDYNATNVVYIDSVTVEKETGCAEPSALQVTELEYNTATFTWRSNKQQWQAQVLIGDSVIETAIVDQPTWTATQLEGNTDYTVAVRAICSETDSSAWVTTAISTPCAPFDVASYSFNFEENLYKYVSTKQIPQCWEAGQLLKASATTYTYVPDAIANTTTYQYSRNVPSPVTDGRALRFYNYSTTYGDSYVILPETDFRLADAYLHFWARAAYFYYSGYTTTANRNRLYAANSNYQKSIVIGVIPDIEDPSTFVPLDTFTYSQSWSSTTGVFTYNDETENDYWEEVLIPLADYAGKGRIAIYYPSNGKTSYFFIDDMEIVGDFCSVATNLRATNVRSTTADLSWTTAGADSVHLQLAYTPDFEEQDIVLDTVLVRTGGNYHATNLQNGRDYYYRVQHLCNEEEIADWVVGSKFVTDYAVRFYEDFSEVRTYPANWQRATAVPEEIFAGTKTLTMIADSYSNWARVAGSTAIATNEMYAPTSTGTGVTNNYWLLTPTIDLSELAEDTTLMLSFRLGLTNQAGGLPNPTAEDDKFIIAVSEDDGATWTADTWWSDADADNATYSYAAIPYSGKLYCIDMAKYIGKRIQIAFISSSTKTASKNYLRLAQVSLNYVKTASYAASICQWEDYEDANFAIDAYNLNVGNTTVYSRYDVAKKAGQADQYVEMSLAVNASVTTVQKATICEGEDYHADGFDITNALSSYVYKQKLQASNTCDSIVELQLTVLPRLYTDVKETICQGNYYEFNGKKYYTTTVQTDTLQSLATGCDSIVTLYLTVNAILTGETDVHLCPEQSVEFGKFGTITTAGTYVDTLQTAILCDSVVTLHVYTHEAAASTVRAAICQGEKYDSDVWSGLGNAGDYPSKQQTVWGCDSIVTLHLLVVGESLQLTDTISVSELPYVLNGEELLPEGTAEGVYTKTIDLSCGKATIAITVGEPMGIGSTFANTLGIAPNPAKVGEPIQVITSDVLNNATLYVISSTGVVIYHADNLCKPMIVPGIPTAGVYLVRVEAEGNVYQAKLMVQ